MFIPHISIDKKWNYIAQDANGDMFFYSHQPTIVYKENWSNSNEWGGFLSSRIKFNLGPDWKESLHKIIHHEDGIELVKVVSRPDLKVDDFVFVADNEKNLYSNNIERLRERLRRFAKWPEQGEGIYTFPGSSCSLTYPTPPVHWQYYRVPTSEELVALRNHKF